MSCQVFHLASSSFLVLSLKKEIRQHFLYCSPAILYHCLTLAQISACVVNRFLY